MRPCCYVILTVCSLIPTFPCAVAEESQEDRTAMTPCTSCSQRKSLAEAELSDEEMRSARIEVIKRQILEKLRLKAPPLLRRPRPVLPALLSGDAAVAAAAAAMPRQEHREASVETSDSFYGTTQQIIVMPDNDSRRCFSKNIYPTTCLDFRIAPHIVSTTMTSAELWVYVTSGSPVPANHTYVVSEVSATDRNHSMRRKRIVAFQDVAYLTSGWIHFQVGAMVNQWLLRHQVPHHVEISCKTCPKGTQRRAEEEPADDLHRPFLVIHTDSSRSPSRGKRHVDCTPGGVRCCRESFYLSFKEIGWDDWILQPPGYTANYCRGACLQDVSISRYHHTTVLQRYLQSQKGKNNTEGLSLCCTPSMMSSISLIYVDDDGYIFQKSLPNMVVETCDCA